MRASSLQLFNLSCRTKQHRAAVNHIIRLFPRGNPTVSRLLKFAHPPTPADQREKMASSPDEQ